MEPVLPPSDGKFEKTAVELYREAGALAASVHPLTRAALIKLVRVVNSYHSNLIEGINTTPAEIEAAMKADYAKDAKRASAQRYAAAHVRLEETVAAEMEERPDLPVTTVGFLRRVHRDLYSETPEPERVVRSPSGRELVVIPGELRTDDVTVGDHLAPAPESLASFLARFDEAYRPEAHTEVRRVVALAASHHRLTWIHPFLDGNGRVARLVTNVYARRIGLDAGGLWSIARGFARFNKEYYAALAAADGPRRNDFDGRGALSLAALEEWCDFVVRVALDQIAYMRSLLMPATLTERLHAYAAFRGFREGGAELLATLVSRGAMSRAAALRHFEGGERTTRSALSEMLRDGVLESPSHRAEVRLAFPERVSSFLFPALMAIA